MFMETTFGGAINIEIPKYYFKSEPMVNQSNFNSFRWVPINEKLQYMVLYVKNKFAIKHVAF